MTFLAVLLLGASVVAPPRTLAVSYFDNTSKDKALEPLRKGLADMMITDLATVPGLKVVERERLETLLHEIKLERSRFFNPKTAQRLGRGLGAQLVLTGSFLVLGDHVRIDVRVVRVATGEVVATDSADGKKSEFFDVEKELVEDLLSTLDVKLDRAHRRRLEHRQTDSFEALRLYSEGLDARDRGNEAAADAAFRAALRADPDYEAAKGALGRVKAIVRHEAAAAGAEAKEVAAHERSPDFGQWLSRLFARIGYDFDTAKYRERLGLLHELVAKNLKPDIRYGSAHAWVEPSPLFTLLAQYSTEPEMLEKLPSVLEYLYLKYPGDPTFSAFAMSVHATEDQIAQLRAAKAKVDAARDALAAGRPFVHEGPRSPRSACAKSRSDAMEAAASVRLLAETTHDPATLDGYAKRFLARYDAGTSAACSTSPDRRLAASGRDAVVLAVAQVEAQMGDRAGFEKWCGRIGDDGVKKSMRDSMAEVLRYRAPVFETRQEANALLDLVVAKSR